MIMLTGIKAFETRWQSLKSVHPTNASENHLLMQSMGRLVDNYATQEEIAAELPAPLRGLFARLVDAYLNGHWTDDLEHPSAAHPTPGLSPAMLAAQQRRQQKKMAPTASSEAATYVIHDRVSCWA
ncbi:MAG: hypothetical protein AAFR12_10595 [Cyanobacteria bacterium J06626_6]